MPAVELIVMMSEGLSEQTEKYLVITVLMMNNYLILGLLM